MRVLEDFWSFESVFERMECTPTGMSPVPEIFVKTQTAFHDLTQIFQLHVQTSYATNKKTRGMVPSGLEASPNASSTQLL